MQQKSSNEVILILILILVGVAYYSYDAFIYREKIDKIARLDKDIMRKNDQLIAAQILDQELSGVARLMQVNMATSTSDDLIKGTAVSFLKFLTRTLDEMKIDLLTINPRPTRKAKKDNYLSSAYSVGVYCNYKKFGKLLTEIEKSDRIIWVDSFQIKSNIDYLAGKDHSRGIDKHVIEMELRTITLLKNEI